MGSNDGTWETPPSATTKQIQCTAWQVTNTEQALQRKFGVFDSISARSITVDPNDAMSSLCFDRTGQPGGSEATNGSQV
jgi:hypothetical protein